MTYEEEDAIIKLAKTQIKEVQNDTNPDPVTTFRLKLHELKQQVLKESAQECDRINNEVKGLRQLTYDDNYYAELQKSTEQDNMWTQADEVYQVVKHRPRVPPPTSEGLDY